MSEIKEELVVEETTIKSKFRDLIDVKSIITLTLVVTLVIIILGQFKLEDNVFQLFSSIITLVCGFFFGKKSE